MLLGYRVSGGVAPILASARLRIDADVVRLEVGEGARVPDSEVVRDRLSLVAAALGIARTEILEAPHEAG
jgi:exopolyphosphatase/guanosine-5'-triphosphate,3'-diphosphate pyrophosphatase